MLYSFKTARLTVSRERSLSQAKTAVGTTTGPSVGISPMSLTTHEDTWWTRHKARVEALREEDFEILFDYL